LSLRSSKQVFGSAELPIDTFWGQNQNFEPPSFDSAQKVHFP